jgi:acyl-CoA reductase-like NAD-dependent aldehyde dehydrogenase
VRDDTLRARNPPAGESAPAAPGVLRSRDPATGEVLGEVAASSPAAVREAVSAAAVAQSFWAQLTLSDRARYMERAAQVVLDEAEEIRELIVREQGRPRVEAIAMELLPSVDALHWTAREGPGLLAGERIRMRQPHLRGKRAAFRYEPLGVIALASSAASPWGVPLAEIAMALTAGNGVVLAPSPLTPLIGERIVRALGRAGIPEGLVSAVHGDGARAALVRSPVAKLLFAGSPAEGRALGEECARALKGAVLELGGKDPMLVLADAPVEHAAACALWAGFAAAGQTAAGIERVYVMREVAGHFLSALVAGAAALRVGDPHAWETEVGPLLCSEHGEIASRLVQGAVAQGARLECGGPLAREPGCWFAPAVLTEVTHEMAIMREPVPGPVLSVAVVESEDQAVALANDCDYGLGASVWTADRGRGERISRELQAGMVWINDHMFSHGACQCSWGGVKSSGMGRTRSRFGLYECVNVKLCTWEPSRLRDAWWHPYDETLARAVSAVMAVVYGRPSIRAGALRAGAPALLRVGGRLARERLRREPLRRPA